MNEKEVIKEINKMRDELKDSSDIDSDTYFSKLHAINMKIRIANAIALNGIIHKIKEFSSEGYKIKSIKGMNVSLIVGKNAKSIFVEDNKLKYTTMTDNTKHDIKFGGIPVFDPDNNDEDEAGKYANKIVIELIRNNEVITITFVPMGTVNSIRLYNDIMKSPPKVSIDRKVIEGD